MPPRLQTGAIILFWLAMTGWLLYREVVPMMLADISPSYTIDLTDEIGAKPVSWLISLNGSRIGLGVSVVRPAEDRTYEFKTTLRFEKFEKAGMVIKKFQSMYRVTEEGKLRAMSAKFDVKIADTDVLGEFRGEVKNNILHPRGFINEKEQEFLELDDIDISKQGNIVNPMHLVSRLRGLRNGQTWKITKIDPLQALKKVGIQQGMSAASLIAEVTTAELEWDGKQVECHKIEYHEPGKEPAARTWVRKIDGFVLQQEATHYGKDLVMRRIPDRN
jgi:hypothetical protein